MAVGQVSFHNDKRVCHTVFVESLIATELRPLGQARDAPLSSMQSAERVPHTFNRLVNIHLMHSWKSRLGVISSPDQLLCKLYLFPHTFEREICWQNNGEWGWDDMYNAGSAGLDEHREFG